MSVKLKIDTRLPNEIIIIINSYYYRKGPNNVGFMGQLQAAGCLRVKLSKYVVVLHWMDNEMQRTRIK